MKYAISIVALILASGQVPAVSSRQSPAPAAARPAAKAAPFDVFEAGIADMQAAMKSGRTTSRCVTERTHSYAAAWSWSNSWAHRSSCMRARSTEPNFESSPRPMPGTPAATRSERPSHPSTSTCSMPKTARGSNAMAKRCRPDN